MYSPNLFTNINALRGKTNIEEQEAFRLPGSPGAMMAFEINTDSMMPLMRRGDMVLCSALWHPDDVIDGHLYAVISQNNVYVRRVKRCISPQGDLLQLELWTEQGDLQSVFRLPIEVIDRVLRVSNIISEFDNI